MKNDLINKSKQRVTLTFKNNVVIVEIYDLPFKHVLKVLSDRFTIIDTRKVGKEKKIVQTIAGIFSWCNEERTVARFNVSASSLILTTFERYGVSTRDMNIRMDIEYPLDKVKIKLKKGLEARPYQKRYIWSISGPNSKRSHLVDLQPGYGKALSNDTLVKIPNGWKKIGDIDLNDKVISRDGTSVHVTGVYPQGIKPMFKITFEDGRTIKCCPEHLWKVYTYNDMLGIMLGEILDTATIVKSKRKVYYVDACQPEKSINVNRVLTELPISTYVKDNTWHYTTTSINESENLINNIRSLGGVIHSQETNGVVTHKYRTRYTSKAIDFTDDYIKITKIEPVRSEEATCISVGHPEKLFVAENYIVTHNTFIGVSSVIANSYRTAIMVKATYVEKWVRDIKGLIDLKEGEYFVVRGSESIDEIAKMKASELKKIKFYVMSMRTMKFYLESWLEDPKSVPIKPDDFFRKTKVGTVLNDESHQEFETFFKLMLFMDVKKIIGLSATMESGQPLQDYMYGLLFPVKDRASNLVKYVKYINWFIYTYTLRDSNIRCKTGMGYNHLLFEQAIMKDMRLLKDYKEMIAWMVQREFINYIEEDIDKCLIFVSTRDMCDIMFTYLKMVYKDRDVRRFYGGDQLTDLLEGEITISTNGSAGTARDISGLLTVIQTVPISGKQLNIQAAGRLREREGRKVRYITLHATNIKSHNKMHQKRMKALEAIIKAYNNDRYLKTLGV